MTSFEARAAEEVRRLAIDVCAAVAGGSTPAIALAAIVEALAEIIALQVESNADPSKSLDHLLGIVRRQIEESIARTNSGRFLKRPLVGACKWQLRPFAPCCWQLQYDGIPTAVCSCCSQAIGDQWPPFQHATAREKRLARRRGRVTLM